MLLAVTWGPVHLVLHKARKVQEGSPPPIGITSDYDFMGGTGRNNFDAHPDTHEPHDTFEMYDDAPGGDE